MSKAFKHISVVAVATLVSRFLGLGRDILVTTVFGVSALASAFYTAFTVPNLFRRLLGEGALTAALVPTLAEEMKARQRPGAFALVNSVASWLFLVTAGIVGLCMATILLVAQRTELTGTLVGGDAAGRWADAANLAVILFPYLIFVCLAAVFSAALQTFNRFLEPALSPIWLNVAMISLLAGAAYSGWSDSEEVTMLWLCGGALLGGFLQMAVPAAALMREGWQPRFDLRISEPVRQIVRLMVPALFGSAIYLINMSVTKVIGLWLNESAVAVLNLATRLMELPIGVFAITVSTVVFPLIARHAAAGDWTNLGSAYRKGVRLILVVNIPAAVGLVVLAQPIIHVLFERGEFRAADTLRMQPVLMVCGLGLPFISFVSIVLRAFYANKDTTTPVRAALLSFFVNLGLSFALMFPFGTVGLAIASNVAVVVQAVFLQCRIVRKDQGLAFRHVAGDLLKVFGASLVMGAVVAAGWWAWSQGTPETKAFHSLGLVLMVALGIVVYGALVWMLRIEGREELTQVLKKVAARFGY